MGREFSTDKKQAYRDLACKSKGKRLLGSPSYRWENIIKMDPNVT